MSIIHAGKIFLNKVTTTKYRPEGYAINLAKRVEGLSREGKFTNIFLSESARGQLYNLKDELTYRFDKPFIIQPKGISRDIRVFEIKHHFLPTDWVYNPAEISVMYGDIDEEKFNIAKRAHEINPTNVWLAEEYLLLSVVNDYKKLKMEGRENDPNALKKAYSSAYEVAQHIANTEMRDAGLLGIWGFICGERLNYKEEQEKYKEAIRLDEQDGEIFWYLAYSMSCKLDEEYEKNKEKYADIKEFYDKNKEEIVSIINYYERASELRPMNPWIIYDYACELSWWSQVDDKMKKDAIDLLIKSFILNSDTKIRAKKEPYLQQIINDPAVKNLLQWS